jgi:flagellar basal body rod protein FlgG
MQIADATARAFENIAARQHDVMQAFTAGAMPERSDVAKPAGVQRAADPLCVVAPPGAYFAIQGDDGRPLFTRDGGFALHDGTLSDESGRPVLGYRGHDAARSTLAADPVDVALGFTKTMRIDPDGSVTYDRTTIDPRTGGREQERVGIGRIALARFAAGTRLQTIDAQHAVAPASSPAHFGRPADGNFGSLTPFERETSGVDLDRGLERLQEAYLALDALRAAGKSAGSLQKTAMDLLT